MDYSTKTCADCRHWFRHKPAGGRPNPVDGDCRFDVPHVFPIFDPPRVQGMPPQLIGRATMYPQPTETFPACANFTQKFFANESDFPT